MVVSFAMMQCSFSYNLVLDLDNVLGIVSSGQRRLDSIIRRGTDHTVGKKAFATTLSVGSRKWPGPE